MTLAQVLSPGQWVQAEDRPRAERPRKALPPSQCSPSKDWLLLSLCALARAPCGLPPCPTQWVLDGLCPPLAKDAELSDKQARGCGPLSRTDPIPACFPHCLWLLLIPCLSPEQTPRQDPSPTHTLSWSRSDGRASVTRGKNPG